jgi:dipeptidyl aminopeptidase/acylaminoacyl peptidase
LTARVALVDPQRQIVVLRPDGRRQTLTAPAPSPVIWGDWSAKAAETSAWSWPTWSPDGSRLACFRIANGNGRGAHVMDLGVTRGGDAELMSLGRRLPIYLQWAPGGRSLAVLSQREDRLVLSLAWPDDVGREVVLAESSPLFFTWAGPSRVAAYLGAGETPGGRMALLDVRGTSETVLPGTPGNFCAPVWIPTNSTGSVVYVSASHGRTQVVRAHDESSTAEPLETVDGLVALVAGPDGRRIARGVAPDGDATPYKDLAILDALTGEVRGLSVEPCLAFLWSPTGDALVVARVDTARNLITWSRLDLADGRSEKLVDLYPTRDLGFYLRFFEQYGPSHPLVDPTGSHLLLAGTVPGRNTTDQPRVWRVGLRDGSVEELGEGLFAVYSPA